MILFISPHNNMKKILFSAFITIIGFFCFWYASHHNNTQLTDDQISTLQKAAKAIVAMPKEKKDPIIARAITILQTTDDKFIYEAVLVILRHIDWDMILPWHTIGIHYTGRTGGDTTTTKESIMKSCATYKVFDSSREDIAKTCDVFIESRDYSKDLAFVVGKDALISWVEKSTIGRTVWESYSILIPYTEAYGARSEENVVEVPIEQLPPLADGKTYSSWDIVQTPYGPVTIVRVEWDKAYIDGNHQLAGKDLIFDIEITSHTKQ